MTQLDPTLDQNRTGSQAAVLKEGLRALVVGQDDAIDQIVSVYQKYLAGIATLGCPIGRFFPRADWLREDRSRGSDR